jgi:polyhydroxyalkanoate synthase
MLLMRYSDPDLVVRLFGNFPADLPGRLMAIGTGMLKPIMGGAGGWLWRLGEGLESFLAVCQWVDDGVPFSGATFRRWIRDFYQRNRLVKGKL